MSGFNDGYRGDFFAAIQTTFPNQMGTALAGDQASANDIMNTEDCAVNESAGVECGLGVLLTAVGSLTWADTSGPAAPPKRVGVNQYGVTLPAIGKLIADLAGVVMRAMAGQANSSGKSGVGYARMAKIAKISRAGSRVWCKTYGNIALGDVVYWIIGNGQVRTYTTIGAFTNATTYSTDAVSAATVAKFVSSVINYNSVTGEGLTLIEFATQ